MHFLLALFSAFPEAPAGSPAEMAQDGITFFTTWIQRTGAIVSFIGAVKLALALDHDDGREQLSAILTMISGFMISSAVGGGLALFNIPAVYTEAAATTEFRAILTFIGRWIRRVGTAGLLFGAILTGMSLKDQSPAAKANGMKLMVVGGMVTAIATIVNTIM